MFAGHLGAAMAVGRVERRIDLGTLVFAALLLDFVLWLLVLSGRESVTIPADFATTHQASFVFPYSHGLLASVGWSVLAGIATSLCYPGLGAARFRAAAAVGAAVFSHWLLDALVHAPELPLVGPASARVGLGLWQTMPAALALEALVTLGGLFLFVTGAGVSRRRTIRLSLLACLVLAFTVAGMTVAPPPPSAEAMAASSLAMIVVVGALAFWLGRRGRAGEATCDRLA